MKTDFSKVIATYEQKVASSAGVNDSVLDAGGAITNVLYDYYSKYYIQKWCNFQKNHCILDFGCGVGRLAIPFAKYVNEVHGVDISPSMIAVAQQQSEHLKNTSFSCISPNEKLNGHYDTIFFFGVLIHFSNEDIESLISNFKACLSPNGRIVFIEPTYKTTIQVNDEVIYRSTDEFMNLFSAFELVHTQSILRNPSYSFHLIKKVKLKQQAFLPFYRMIEELTINRKPNTVNFFWTLFVFENSAS